VSKREEEKEEKMSTEEQVVVEDCSNSDVVTKYRLAAEIAQTALEGVIGQCVAGKKVVDICTFGDAVIEQRCASVFKSKKVEKGIAFPTCVNLNNEICHVSPLKSDENSPVLKAGDWAKIDLGVHVDGYISLVAHTVKVPESADGVNAKTPADITEEENDLFQAAQDAIDVCHRLIKPGNTNAQVTKALEDVAETYGVKALSGTVMHQMKRFVIDANKTIVLKNDPENKVPKVTFEANETYGIDICFTLGSDKPTPSETRTTVFKRSVANNYQLKMKASRVLFNDVNKRFPTLPFTLRAFDDERAARMGVVEPVKHEVLIPYPIMLGRPEDKIVHMKATVLLLPSGTTKITGLTFEGLESKKTRSEEIESLLAISMEKKKKNKKKNKKKKKAAAE